MEQELDTFRIYLATSYYERAVRTGLVDTEVPEDILEGIPKPSRAGQAEANRKHLYKQVEELFTYVVDTGGMDPYPQPVKRNADTEPTVSRLDLLSSHEERESMRDTDILEKEIQHFSKRFCMYIRKSTIDHPAAGLGVLVSLEHTSTLIRDIQV